MVCAVSDRLPSSFDGQDFSTTYREPCARHTYFGYPAHSLEMLENSFDSLFFQALVRTKKEVRLKPA